LGKWDRGRKTGSLAEGFFLFPLYLYSFSPAGKHGVVCREGKNKDKEVLRLTVKDAKAFISTAKIAKGRERSSVVGGFSRLFAVKINF
jgi:hypothetical protein